MSRRTVVITVIVAAVGLATLGLAWAVGPEDGDTQGPRARIAELIQGRFARMSALRDELNVTDQQRDEIREIMQSHRDELRPTVVAVIEHKRALRQAVMAEQADEAAIRAEADALGDAIGDAAVAISKVTGEARTVLTNEQLEMLEDAMVEHQERVDEFIENAP